MYQKIYKRIEKKYISILTIYKTFFIGTIFRTLVFINLKTSICALLHYNNDNYVVMFSSQLNSHGHDEPVSKDQIVAEQKKVRMTRKINVAAQMA